MSYLDAAATTVEDLQIQAPTVPADVLEQVMAADPTRSGQACAIDSAREVSQTVSITIDASSPTTRPVLVWPQPPGRCMKAYVPPSI